MISIEVFKSNQANRKVVSKIDDREISALRRVFNCFKNKTGIFIDEYGKTLLHNSSISILLECFEESIKDNKTVVDIEIFYNLFLLLRDENYSMLLIGD